MKATGSRECQKVYCWHELGTVKQTLMMWLTGVYHVNHFCPVILLR